MVRMKSHIIRKYSTQNGGALIIMALILLLAGTTALFSVLDGNGAKIERDKKCCYGIGGSKSSVNWL